MDSLRARLIRNRSAPSSTLVVQRVKVFGQHAMEVARMPYTTNQGIRIHYQMEGAGPPLILQHGFTASLEPGTTGGMSKR